MLVSTLQNQVCRIRTVSRSVKQKYLSYVFVTCGCYAGPDGGRAAQLAAAAEEGERDVAAGGGARHRGAPPRVLRGLRAELHPDPGLPRPHPPHPRHQHVPPGPQARTASSQSGDSCQVIISYYIVKCLPIIYASREPASPLEQLMGWQNMLHSQSSKKIQEYLDLNLQQIEKVNFVSPRGYT